MKIVKRKNKRTVFITGATSDIGKAIAIRFAKEGWDVILHYFSHDKTAKELKNEIEKTGVKCRIIKADLSSEAGLRRLVKYLAKLDIASLVNNAGTYTVSKHFTKLTIKDIHNTFMVNAFSPMLIAARLFPRMQRQNFGRIVNISSIAAKYGGSGHSMHYGSSKRALEGLTKTLARVGARHNVLVNTIRPGVIDTSFHKKFPKDMNKRIALIPLKKMGKPRDISDMAYYLGSEKNSFITNENITVSGGE